MHIHTCCSNIYMNQYYEPYDCWWSRKRSGSINCHGLSETYVRSIFMSIFWCLIIESTFTWIRHLWVMTWTNRRCRRATMSEKSHTLNDFFCLTWCLHWVVYVSLPLSLSPASNCLPTNHSNIAIEQIDVFWNVNFLIVLVMNLLKSIAKFHEIPFLTSFSKKENKVPHSRVQ